MRKKPSDLYREEILKLWRNPKNFGELENPTHEHFEANPICGDVMSIHLRVEEGIVKGASFFGTGCLVCIVFASELTDVIKGKTEEEVLKMTKDDLLKLLNIKITPLKMQCACLSLDAVQNCLKKGKLKD
jgi:nitrogen fixation NifU-like protein